MIFLFLGSHMDDVEITSGGTIHKLISQGHEVQYSSFSACHNPLALELENIKATKALGIPRTNIKNFEFPVRHFSQYSQDIADLILRLEKEIKPDAVFTQSANDKHPDHAEVGRQALRVLKCSVLTFTSPWNGAPRETYFVQLSKENLNAKLNAVACYKSQEHRPYTKGDFILSMAQVSGIKANCEYAEGFEVVRMIS
jgi:LmbE family N-acetylglucosaminyl deacetylase